MHATDTIDGRGCGRCTHNGICMPTEYEMPHTHNYRSEDENVLKKETLTSVALKL